MTVLSIRSVALLAAIGVVILPGTSVPAWSAGTAAPAPTWEADKLNVFRFKPCEARFIRLVILGTNTGSPPALDCVELYAAGSDANLALAAQGAKVTASASLEAHGPERLITGDSGPTNCLVCMEEKAKLSSWVMIELPKPARVDRIGWSRDRTGMQYDRVPTEIRVEVSENGRQWRSVLVDQLRVDTPGSRVTPPPAPARGNPQEAGSPAASLTALLLDAIQADFAPVEARFVRVLLRQRYPKDRSATRLIVDEIELYGANSRENLALASRGTKAGASSHWPSDGRPNGQSYHISRINDGRYGGDSAWSSAERGAAWVELELPSPERIARAIAFAECRAASGNQPVWMEVFASTDGRNWNHVGAGFPSGTVNWEAADANHWARSAAFLQEARATKPAPDPFTDMLARLEVQATRDAALGRNAAAQRQALSGWKKRVAALGPAKTWPSEAQKLFVEMAQAERAGALGDPELAGLGRLLLVCRRGPASIPDNWLNLSAVRSTHDALCVFDVATGAIETLYETDRGIHDVDLHWDGRKVLFSSMTGDRSPTWAVWEFDLEKRGEPKRISPADEKDVHWFDACYLPNDEIILASTAAFQGVPCIVSNGFTCNLYRLDPAKGSIRQLTFDQEQCWNPTVREDGMVMYTRWEYMDTPHPLNRQVFVMMPDGSNQRSMYGSNKVWPPSVFQARQVPGESVRFIAITSGHHSGRAGDLVLFDVGQGSADGKAAVAFLNDPDRRQGLRPPDNVNFDSGLINRHYLMPWPVDGRRFLASYLPRGGTYFQLTLNSLSTSKDAADSMLTLLSLAETHCLEAMPLAARPRPPVIQDRVDTNKDYGVVMVSDVYQGPGLAGVPRGTIKSLRLVEPYYAPYRGYRVPGIAGPWDMRRIVGTVPVEADGSAAWKAPANVPLSIQALDAGGQAVAIMRSWYTAMPGETISCLGCHESRLQAGSKGSPPLAAQRTPSTIAPWHGPARGFSFLAEVQPVLDRYCVGCHDGSKPGRPDFASMDIMNDPGWGNSKVAQSYYALQAFVHRPGPESNATLPVPMEWHADTSDLVQMLRKGHHGVQLDAEAWDRLITWIDLNVPYHGNWADGKEHPSLKRRHELWTKYAKPRESMELLPERPKVAFQPPPKSPEKPQQNLAAPGWPFSSQEAAARVAQAAQSQRLKPELNLDLGEGVSLRLVLIPAGSFVMGSRDGYDDEYPQTVVTLQRPFYMAAGEITNAQFARFDPQHDSGRLNQYGHFQSTRGPSLQGSDQPVIRVNWHRAREFCAWLSAKTGLAADLPSEAQWEWACRAGAATPLWFGERDQPWVREGKRLDNLADQSLKALISAAAGVTLFMPYDKDINDGATAPAPAAGFEANAFGLVHMHGNVREWTRSLYRPYPYSAADGREDPSGEGRRVVRGGSFYDLPKRATASHRLGYLPWMRPWNVGFRVIVQDAPSALARQYEPYPRECSNAKQKGDKR